MGQLQRCLAGGEYGQLQDCPLFESDFLQVTKSGDVASRVTLGIAATSPCLELPDLMLLARPVPLSLGSPCHYPQRLPTPGEELELFGLLPLQFVRLSIHDERQHRLKVRLASGRTFYLQLLAPPAQLERVFGQWVRLLYRLRFHCRGAPRAWDSLLGLGAGAILTPCGGRDAAGQVPARNQTHRSGGGRSLPSPPKVTPGNLTERQASTPNKS
uniref:Family with sequence similarity 71 member E1 n=1 Tax=Pelusios castaneus TaxID=367368 RepID=A0A8C8S154_9SAUR